MANLEQIMKENWKKVKAKFYFPDIPDPKLVESTDKSSNTMTASIDMILHRIRVNKDFVEYFAEKGVSYDAIFTGLLAHELNHYLTCPYDLFRSMCIDLYARKVDKNVANTASSIYVDLVDNLDIVLKKNVQEVATLLAAQDAPSPLKKILKAYCQRAMQVDFNFDTNKELDDFGKAQLERLFTIDFLDQKSEQKNVTRLTRIVRDIIENYKSKEDESQNSKPKSKYIDSLGEFNPAAYDKNEINKAIKQLAAKLQKDDFEDILENSSILEQMAEMYGIKADDSEGKNQLRDVLYYLKLAENYQVGIKKRKLQGDGELFPYKHKEFEIDDNTQDIDMFTSLGKPFIPGLGKVWQKTEGHHYGSKEETPNVLIMKDVSRSMIDCEPHAEVACVATAKAYIENGSEVGVYLFNDKVNLEVIAKGFSSEEVEIAKALTISNSGGTKITPKSLKSLDQILKKSEKPVDIVLVTDLDIEGREELFSYLHDRTGAHRVTIIYTGKNGGIRELQEKYNNSNFSIYHITNPEQIPDVVIGDIAGGLK